MNVDQISKILFPLLRLFPKKRVVLFNSFFGQYNDNPKYVSEVLRKKYPSIKQVWVVKKSINKFLPKEFDTVRYASLKYYYYLANSVATVDNMMGSRGTFTDSKGNLLRKIFIGNKQYNISTWHGTPLKNIGNDVPGANKNTTYITSAVYLTSGCEYFSRCIKSSYPGVVLKECGTPRNDILVNGVDSVDQMKIKLNIPPEKHVVLFAPTFRDDIQQSGIAQMQHLDIKRLLNELKKKFGGEWVFVYRVHHIVEEKLTDLSFDNNVINGNYGEDMAEYLSISDVLITDYSSSMFDYALTKKPCFLFALDREYYESVERGFYVSINDLPFEFSGNNEELINCIIDFDEYSYKLKIEEFLLSIGNKENGTASEYVADSIASILK